MQIIDQLHRNIDFSFPPKKIISLVPSITELLIDLGVEEKIYGVTKFCVHPAQIRKTKTIVGGTKNLHIDTIKNLQPDLIIASKEENLKEQIEQLDKFFPVWVSDVKTFDDAINMITSIGKINDAESMAIKIVKKILSAKETRNTEITIPLKTVYLIWKNPYMTVGCDTFIHSMLTLAGFENLTKQQERYPEISEEQLEKLQPEVILLSSEPYPFKLEHITELKEKIPQAKVLLADGELFSWYGSRLQYSFRYFDELHKLLY